VSYIKFEILLDGKYGHKMIKENTTKMLLQV
jgi:hypothetical protein